MGTALIARGLRLSDESPESWLWTHPEQVAEVHRGFAEASACVLQTNTFGLVRLLGRRWSD
jgi:methionine synthase I (cobalamin-dependent)